MSSKDVVIIGGGPCGLSAAIELQNKGLDVLVIEKGNIVNSIYRYPTHQTFFSSSIKLSIGDIPFITAKEKPKRNDALVYYRTVAKMKDISLNSFETVRNVKKTDNGFIVESDKNVYSAKYVVVATGYYDNPNKLDVPGADLPKVFNYFKEGHPFFGKNVVIIGGKNSAIDAAIELVRAGASVTALYRGSEYSPSVKPWILPTFDSFVRSGEIAMHFNTTIEEITETSVKFDADGEKLVVSNDYVFAMIGYHPDHEFLSRMGVQIDKESGRPKFDDSSMESNVEGLYIAGVIAAGNNSNEIFIENGRLHGGLIAEDISRRIL